MVPLLPPFTFSPPGINYSNIRCKKKNGYIVRCNFQKFPGSYFAFYHII